MSLASGIPASAVEHTQMGVALAAAQEAAAAGEVPVGAAIFTNSGEQVAVAANTRATTGDIAGHAEINAINAAIAATGERVLAECVLVVTLEPCAMCAGAILAARVGKVVFGAWDEKAGSAGSVYDLVRDGRLPHPTPEVVSGVREQECAALLQEFFSARR